MLRVGDLERARPRPARSGSRRARLRLLDEQLNPVYLEAARIDRDAVQQLGAPNYYELYKRFGFRLDELAEECTELLDSTERQWEEVGRPPAARAARRSGSPTRGRGTSPRLFRAPEWDKAYKSGARWFRR